MATICPTITTENTHVFRQQVEKVTPFAKRIHIDLADGVFAPTKLVDVNKIWWPEAVTADIHLMYQNPAETIAKLTALKPNLVILHAEADGDFMGIASTLQNAGVKVGLALLADTEVNEIKDALAMLDHVLVFSGKLGYQGGRADLSLLGKVSELKALKPELEIGWDGGINLENAGVLVKSGVDVLNTGGYIQRAASPEAAYKSLLKVI